MSQGGKIAIWIVAIASAAGALAAVLLLHHARHKPLITIEGAVITQSSQAEKESPVSGAEITARHGNVSASCKSDSSGFFKLSLQEGLGTSLPITLELQHRGYQPLVLPVVGGGKPYVLRMVPTAPQGITLAHGPPVTVSNVSVRYSAKTATAVNVGSTVKTFQVVNSGGTPCNHQQPCSPDGKWKAAQASISLDAGSGNVFRNVRVSCIAGPCPFTRIIPQNFPSQEKALKVSAIAWSDTATFLVEAEVYHPLQNAAVRKSYPVIFGRVMDFTLPATSEGVCIEADLHGEHIIFPLGPSPDLSWATCTVSGGKNKMKAYRCVLKDSYRF